MDGLFLLLLADVNYSEFVVIFGAIVVFRVRICSFCFGVDMNNKLCYVALDFNLFFFYCFY